MITKKGISPLIATVLIIGFTIVLAAMVMQWGSGLFEKIKGETSISSEVNLICSSGLSNLAVTSAKLTGTSLVVTIDNSNEQAITGFLFRGHKSDGSVVTKEKSETADALTAFGVGQYTFTTTVAVANNPATPEDESVSGGDLPGLIKGDEVGVMAIVTAADGSPHTCTNEKLVTITVPAPA